MVPFHKHERFQSTYPFSMRGGVLVDYETEYTPTAYKGRGGMTQNKVFPVTATKVKAAKRVRKVLKGQNYLQLRGKY